VSAPNADTESNPFLTRERQLLFEGQRSGRGYFSRDGSLLVFESRREPGNPFYQIYVMDLGTGDARRVSPGVGEATRGWLHPGNGKVLFASTHLDPQARSQQAAEPACQHESCSRGYDEHHDLFIADLSPRSGPDGASRPRAEGVTAETPGAAEDGLQRLTDSRGYDAEPSWSPDGHWIAFSSNRDAHSRELSEGERKLLESDGAHFVDVYIMDAGGQNPRRLTHSAGCDSGTAFSPDGGRIAWQRCSERSDTAELFSMRTDGRDQRQLTHLGALSRAPFYHPSGDYLIFSADFRGPDSSHDPGGLHGSGRELYLVDAGGHSDPVRVTHNQVLDDLPAFSPDGDTLVWSRETGPGDAAQLFIADWDDALAREALELPSQRHSVVAPLLPLPESSSPSISVGDLRAHVRALASEKTEGRLAGSAGERIATSYVARAFRSMGLEPAGDHDTYFQNFGFDPGDSAGQGQNPQRRQARSVLARLPADRPQDAEQRLPMIAIGAHVDHLGRGDTGSFRVVEHDHKHEKGVSCLGADDNASGVAALLEIAQQLAYRRDQGTLDTRRDILFAAWSGSELGRLGSRHFIEELAKEEEKPPGKPVAYLDLDTVGRSAQRVSLHGVDSSSIWPRQIEKHNLPIGLSIHTHDDGHPPTDADPFDLEGVPTLSASTGGHGDTHTPRHVPEELDYEGLRDVARLMGAIVRSLAAREQAPDYIAATPPERKAPPTSSE
jgi:Tol biopolymer transport system component